jgi:23S rRNA (guanine745-N1)-methyltransferase
MHDHSALSALDLVAPILRCPNCAEPISRSDTALRCAEGHSFDIARHGYASLLPGVAPISGDDGPMVSARQRVLGTGAFAPVLAALIDLVAPPARSSGTVVDAGCGPGYYLAGLMDAWPSACGLGLDSSVHALRSAARAHPRAAAVACDLFRPLPVASASADLVLNVFSPRNPTEFRRILRPDGRLVVVRPTGDHLSLLRGQVEGMVGIDPAKESRLRQALDPYFEEMATVRTQYTTRLTPQEAADLVLMTPSAHHVTIGDSDEDVAGALPVEVDISVLTTAYRPRSRGGDS